MSFLRALVAAIAARDQIKHEPAPVEPGYTGAVRSNEQPALSRAVTAVIGDGLDEFLALPLAKQQEAIEQELTKLGPDELKSVMSFLGDILQKKWIPMPGPQTDALRSEAMVVLYGGAAGGGKTDLILGTALTEHKRSLILRQQYDPLKAMTDRICEIYGSRQGFVASPPPYLKTDDGRLIEFSAADDEKSTSKLHGRPHDLLAFDEAAHFQESTVRLLKTWVRTTDPNQRCRIIMATNPPLSSEGAWLVTHFRPWLDPMHPRPAKYGELRWFITNDDGDDEEVDGPGPYQIKGEMVAAESRTFIPAKVKDNAYYTRDNRYLSMLATLREPQRSAYMEGNFMAGRLDAAWQIIPSAWVRAAIARWNDLERRWGGKPPDGRQMTSIAADIAQGGDDLTVLARRHGNWFNRLIVEKGKATPDGKSVAALVLMHRSAACQVVVDNGGGWGGATIERLRDNEIPVHPFRGADSSTEKTKITGYPFANKRAEAWWRFREALDPESGENVALPPDSDLEAELTSVLYISRVFEQRGIVQVESKEEVRKRLSSRSPDRADAVVMAWAHGGLLEFERQRDGHIPGFGRPPRVVLGHAAGKRMRA